MQSTIIRVKKNSERITRITKSSLVNIRLGCPGIILLDTSKLHKLILTHMSRSTARP